MKAEHQFQEIVIHPPLFIKFLKNLHNFGIIIMKKSIKKF